MVKLKSKFSFLEPVFHQTRILKNQEACANTLSMECMEFYHRCSESLTVLGKNSEILFTKPCQGSGETERTTQVEPSSTVTTTQVSTLVSSLTTSLRCNFHRKSRKRNYSDSQIQNLISRTHFWLVLWSFLPGVIMTVSCIFMCIARSLNLFLARITDSRLV